MIQADIHINGSVLLKNGSNVLLLVVDRHVHPDLLQNVDLLLRPRRPDDLDLGVDDLSVFAYKAKRRGAPQNQK